MTIKYGIGRTTTIYFLLFGRHYIITTHNNALHFIPNITVHQTKPCNTKKKKKLYKHKVETLVTIIGAVKQALTYQGAALCKQPAIPAIQLSLEALMEL